MPGDLPQRILCVRSRTYPPVRTKRFLAIGKRDNGVLADGSPEFPDKVIGKWTCRGWNVGRGIYTETGPLAVTTQTFEFFETDGASLTTDGYELIDEGVPCGAVVIGGTGDYMGARGESNQTFVGWNATEGFNLVFTFKLVK